MKPRTALIIVALACLGLALLIYAILNHGSITASPRTLNLNEYGVALEIPSTLSDLTYIARDESAKGPGTVLHMYTGDQCDLGALYEIKKNAIPKSNTTWTEKTLKQFEVPQGQKPAQVKEFTDFYLVFEPNPDTCAADEKGKAAEKKQQLDLWNALTTAHYMQ